MKRLVLFLTLFSTSSILFAGGTPTNGFPGPPPTDPLAQVAYNEEVWHYLKTKEYGDWQHDEYWRLTGRLNGTVTVDASGNIVDGSKDSQYGVHIPCRIYYSPEVYQWMLDGYPDRPLPDGSVIIKEGTGWNGVVEALAATVPVSERSGTRVVKTNITEDLPITAWVVMVRKRSASFDGWYWFDFTNGDTFEASTLPYGELSAVTPDWGAMPAEPSSHWFDKSPTTAPKYFTGGTSGEVIYPSYQFGYYCINCHASAISNSTFSDLDNVVGDGTVFPAKLTFQTESSAPRADVAEKTPHKGDIETVASHAAAAHLDNPYAPPLDQANPLFAETFSRFTPWDDVSWDSVWKKRFPARTYDHVPSTENADQLFITSDQCQGCHDASILNSTRPNMQITDGDAEINVSPYGEWQASMMGLAGRDPIFYSQLESEQQYFPQKADYIANLCLKCHGAMGQRQFHLDNPEEKYFTREMMAAWPGSDPKQASSGQAMYGGLGRDGISCAVCHHISEEGLGTPETFTGNFNTGPPDELYGPFEDVIPKPMENALGITPVFGKQTLESELCGSCHAIYLPVLDAETGEQIGAGFEQTTYLEWLNSVFSGQGYGEPQLESCQTCHMPNTYHLSDGREKQLSPRIANIEASTVGGDFPYMPRALPNEDLTLKKRPEFARHMLAGINLFGLEMFRQFPLVLGIMQSDYMVGTQQSLVTAQQSGLQLAKHESVEVEVANVSKNGNTVYAEVGVANLAGHFFPSGVGFRRAFIRFEILDDLGRTLFASGETNEIGVIVDHGGTPLPTEFLIEDPRLGTNYQPHYEEITGDYQVQIYEELVKNSEDQITTSFLELDEHLKDNRLRGRGWRPDGPYAEETKARGNAADDPYYYDPALTGADVVAYRITLDEETAQRADSVRVSLFYQAIPPYYLMQRFQAAVPETQFDDIQRLYFLASRLNTQDRESPIKDWRLQVGATVEVSLGSPEPSSEPQGGMESRRSSETVRGGAVHAAPVRTGPTSPLP